MARGSAGIDTPPAQGSARPSTQGLARSLARGSAQPTSWGSARALARGLVRSRRGIGTAIGTGVGGDRHRGRHHERRDWHGGWRWDRRGRRSAGSERQSRLARHHGRRRADRHGTIRCVLPIVWGGTYTLARTISALKFTQSIGPSCLEPPGICEINKDPNPLVTAGPQPRSLTRQLKFRDVNPRLY